MARKNSNERNRIFAEEAAVVEVQALLQELMEKKGWSRADLARSMNVSRARITQIFSDECTNLTVRVLARAFIALGEELKVGAATREVSRGSVDCSTIDPPFSQIDRNWIEISDYSRALVSSSANDNIFVGLTEMRNDRDRYEEMAA